MNHWITWHQLMCIMGGVRRSWTTETKSNSRHCPSVDNCITITEHKTWTWWAEPPLNLNAYKSELTWRRTGIVGLISVIRSKSSHPYTLFYCLTIFCFLLTYMFVGISRYRAPLEPMLMLFAAAGIGQCISIVKQYTRKKKLRNWFDETRWNTFEQSNRTTKSIRFKIEVLVNLGQFKQVLCNSIG